MAKQPENRTRLRSLLRNEDGIMAVIFAAPLPVFVVFAALAIDMGYAFQKRNMLQVDASAACLAGAGRLMDDGVFDPVNEVIIYATVDRDGDGVPDDGAAGDEKGAVILIEALAYAEKNMPGEDILGLVDVMPGNWDPATRTFTRAGFWNPDELTFTEDPATLDLGTMTWGAPNAVITPLNACLAITRRAQDGPNNDPLPLFLATAVGLPEIDINTAAIATVGAETPIGFNGCLMALNPDEDATFYANGGRYRLSVEEFLNWEQLIATHGLRGLRVTRTQEYRQSERKGDRREGREV